MFQERKITSDSYLFKTSFALIRKITKLFFLIVFLFSIEIISVSCTKKNNEKENVQIDFTEIEFNGLKLHGRKIQPEYATQFCIYKYDDGYSLIDILGKEKYLIVPEEKYSAELNSIKKTLGLNAVIKRGIKNIYLASSSAYSLWAAIGAEENLGFSSIKENDWYIESAYNAMKSGKIIYAGKYRMPDYELLLKSGCKFAVESTMILHVPKVKEKLEQLGISVFTDYSSYENNPLGRLEWVKVYGEISDCQNEADLFFDSQIELLRNIVSTDKLKRKTSSNRIKSSFFYFNSRGMVVVRNQDNYISNMIKCAGSDYICPLVKKKSELKSKPTLSVSMEEFFKSAKEADFLFYDGNIDSSCKSLAGLKEKNPLFAEFDAVKKANVWCAKKLIYQDTAEISKIILDMNKIFSGVDEKEIVFFERLK